LYKNIFALFYLTMLRRARLCHNRPYVVCPSVCLSLHLSVSGVHVPWSHRLEYFENNFTAE